MDVFEFDFASRILIGFIAWLAFVAWNSSRRHQKVLKFHDEKIEQLEKRVNQIESDNLSREMDKLVSAGLTEDIEELSRLERK